MLRWFSKTISLPFSVLAIALGCIFLFFIMLFSRYDLVLQPKQPGLEEICPSDARICPDGSAVARVGPRCEFTPCPPFVQKDIRTFEECVAAGNTVLDSDTSPRECHTPDGKRFIDRTIRSFQDCIDVGYHASNVYPKQCATPESKLYSQNTQVGIRIVDDYSSCVEAGFSVTASTPKRCVTPNGHAFTDFLHANYKECIDASYNWDSITGCFPTVEVTSPTDRYATYPDEPIGGALPSSISARYVVEHRSALHKRIVRLRAKVVDVILGDKTQCPKTPGRERGDAPCFAPPPSIILADDASNERNKNYDIPVYIASNENEDDYTLGTVHEVTGFVESSANTIGVRKFY